MTYQSFIRLPMPAPNFIWESNGILPNIEEHTKRKLDVLKNYLDVYFETVVRNPALDQLNITLVDGFSGGGAYIDGAETRPGSLLVLLKSIEAAVGKLNEGRTKPLEINARFIFVDDEREHVEALRRELRRSGYSDDERWSPFFGQGDKLSSGLNEDGFYG
ncbi:three-Cys-motif partner protein TcmP [Komagataeibacter diospyri]|uniref:three-Cys-motif partner protein TcmP n=1 Tax=Komagataeibacter diospyri TaxID=1932662 RepID=UPI003756D489